MRGASAHRERPPCGVLLLPTAALALLLGCSAPHPRTAHAPPSLKLSQLAEARIDETALGDMRGGIRVNGFDLNIGYVLDTVAGGQQLTTTMSLNNNGTLTAIGTQVIPPTPPHVVPPTAPNIVPPASPIAVAVTVPIVQGPATVTVGTPTMPTPANPSPPVATVPPAVGDPPKAVAQQVANALGVPPAGTAPTLAVEGLGTSNFKATLGSPDTTQIVQQLTGSSVQTVISNRLDGISISQTSTLNVTINNLAQLSARFLTMPALSTVNRELATFRPR